MSQDGIIEVGRDYGLAPKNICPHCERELHLMIDAFKPEITKIVSSNCPHCNGEIFAAVMIITTKTHQEILNAVQSVLNMFNPNRVVEVKDEGAGNA